MVDNFLFLCVFNLPHDAIIHICWPVPLLP